MPRGVARACRCGATMRGSVGGRGAADAAAFIERAWDAIHTGPGHEPVAAAQARAVRRDWDSPRDDELDDRVREFLAVESSR